MHALVALKAAHRQWEGQGVTSSVLKQIRQQSNFRFWGVVSPQYRAAANLKLLALLGEEFSKNGNQINITENLAGISAQASVALPKICRTGLQNNSIAIVSIPSHIRWMKEVVCHLAINLRCWRFVLRSVMGRGLPHAVPDPYSVLVGVKWDWLPHNDAEADVSDTFLSWFLHQSDFPAPKDTVWAVVQDVPANGDAQVPGAELVNSALPALPTLSARLRFLADASWITASVFFHFAVGSWASVIMFRNAVELAYVQRLRDQDLADLYLFNTTNMNRRPLWSYDAQARGKTVALVDYSTNCIPFVPGKPDMRPVFYQYAAQTWPVRVVWSEDQVASLKYQGAQSETYVVVDMVFSNDNGAPVPDLSEKGIVVFDIDPLKRWQSAMGGGVAVHHDQSTVMAFLESCFRSICEAGFTPVWKPKGGRLSPLLQSFYLKRIVELYGVHVINENVSPTRLIKNTRAVVSFPFTSPSVMGDRLGKPSVFYDPRAMLEGMEFATHGVEIKNGEKALKQWLRLIEQT